jgi:hypothetical protein
MYPGYDSETAVSTSKSKSNWNAGVSHYVAG